LGVRALVSTQQPGDIMDVGHAYYVPDKTKLEDIALNHADNGYSQYPQLKVHEVLEYGRKYL